MRSYFLTIDLLFYYNNIYKMCDNEPCSNFQYLKPLSIESLFEVDDCTKYADTLEKAKRVRNAFFSAKTAVYNFLQDCDVIADTLQSDLSDNPTEMSNIEDQYFAILNNLTSAMYTSLKTTYTSSNGLTKQLINVDLAKIEDYPYGTTQDDQGNTLPSPAADNFDTIYAARPQKSNDLTFNHPFGNGVTVLCHIPGVTIQLNKINKLLKIKFAQPEFMSGYNRHGSYKKEKDIITTLVLAPSIFCTTDFTPWNENTEEVNSFTGGCNPSGVATFMSDPVNIGGYEATNVSYTNNEGTTQGTVNQNGWNQFYGAGTDTNIDSKHGDPTNTVFSNVDIAMDFFEEFQNYQDNYIINADMSYGNQVLEVMNYLDRTIQTMEGAHKFVVQLSKINGTQPSGESDKCDC